MSDAPSKAELSSKDLKSLKKQIAARKALAEQLARAEYEEAQRIRPTILANNIHFILKRGLWK